MLRPLAFACIAAAMTLPAVAADLSDIPRYGHGKVMEPVPLAGRGRYLEVQSPTSWDKITSYSPAPTSGAPVQIHRYFGEPQVSYY